MAKIHGKNTHFELADTGGTSRDLSSWLTQVDFPETIDTAEKSAFGDGDKSYVVGLRGHTIKLTGQYDQVSNGPDDVLGNLAGGTVQPAFVYGPGGSATGSPKYTGAAILNGYQITSPIGGVVTFTADLMVNGAVTRGTF